MSTACYTRKPAAALKAAGFEVLTDKKYLTSDAYLLEGDILLNDGAHVATNLTNGAKASGGGAFADSSNQEKQRETGGSERI